MFIFVDTYCNPLVYSVAYFDYSLRVHSPVSAFTETCLDHQRQQKVRSIFFLTVPWGTITIRISGSFLEEVMMVRVMAVIVLLLCVVMVLTGCGTGTKFVLPEGTRVYLPAKDRTFSPGRAKARPFSWGSAGGIQYSLVREGKTVKEGDLTSNFRLMSLFWPPLAIIYWPIGFKSCYDLTGPEAVLCNN